MPHEPVNVACKISVNWNNLKYSQIQALFCPVQ